ncbi:hypothetical protein VTL71DRAFT_5420 [Oculimacula yallundae]|uniref:Zn(2)-C6 fungal-type domain-containing protein n=1 Tax=Oculimacula yallundae TaxID=86028 RepID=A0ABR4C118_9HELO
MALEPAQQRKRRRAPKVKTGCGTCRLRRIKCDESQPSCQRCSKTGRTCDGYGSYSRTPSRTPEDSPAISQRISVLLSDNSEENRGFAFFIQNTAAELSGYYDSSFWGKLVLAASAQNPSLRHAVVALGALHEDFARKRLMPLTPSAEEENATFALNQYAKAMGELRKSLLHGKEEPLTALMSCVLFVCFDSLRGWYESAMIHLESGLKIMRDMKSTTKYNEIEENISPVLKRLSLQTIIYVEARSAQDRTEFARKLMDVPDTDAAVAEEFQSLEEARNALNQAMDGLFRVFYLFNDDIPMFLQSTENLDLLDKYTTQLADWNVTFEKLMVSKSKDFTSREIQGAALLKIHHTTAKIIAGIHTGPSELRTPYGGMRDKNDDAKNLKDFEIVVNLSRPLITAVEQNAQNGKPSLTFSCDTGLIGPLYYVCIKCPSVSLRKSAMELLLRCPRREGMWNSVLIAQMIQQFWDLEANHTPIVDEFGFPVPFTDNGAIHNMYFARPIEVDSSSLPCSPGSQSLLDSPGAMQVSTFGLPLNRAIHERVAQYPDTWDTETICHSI